MTSGTLQKQTTDLAASRYVGTGLETNIFTFDFDYKEVLNSLYQKMPLLVGITTVVIASGFIIKSIYFRDSTVTKHETITDTDSRVATTSEVAKLLNDRETPKFCVKIEVTNEEQYNACRNFLQDCSDGKGEHSTSCNTTLHKIHKLAHELKKACGSEAEEIELLTTWVDHQLEHMYTFDGWVVLGSELVLLLLKYIPLQRLDLITNYILEVVSSPSIEFIKTSLKGNQLLGACQQIFLFIGDVISLHTYEYTFREIYNILVNLQEQLIINGRDLESAEVQGLLKELRPFVGKDGDLIDFMKLYLKLGSNFQEMFSNYKRLSRDQIEAYTLLAIDRLQQIQ